MFGEVYDYIEECRNNQHIGIPLGFEGKFGEVLNCIDKGDLWIVTAQTSCFKSAFLRSKIIIPILNYAARTPSVTVKLKIFLLEENERDFIIQIISYLLYSKFQVEISEDRLHGRGEKLSDEEMQMIVEIKPALDFFNEHVEILTQYKHPQKMYEYVRDFMLENGTLTYTNKNGKDIPKEYIPDDPNTYVFFIVDHVSEMEPEKGETLFEILDDLRKKYCMSLKNLYRVIPILVQQQTMTGDTLVLNSKGETLADKLAPSLSELADNKGTARAATHVISLFNPANYDLDEYKQFKGLRRLKDNFLYLMVHKNRRGKKNVGVGLWVRPVPKFFNVLPNPVTDTTAYFDFIHQQQNNP